MKKKSNTSLTFTAIVFTFVSLILHKNSSIQKINHFLIVLLSFCFCLTAYESKAQLSYKVLFLGNSYTGANNLPQLIHDVALSAGDTLDFDSYTPGGYQLIDHSIDVTSQNKIMAGAWEYVVIQGQSQEPITQSTQFGSGGATLYNQIKQYNSCAVVMPYMTWGRKNGDQSNCAAFPVMCTYQGMDTTLRNRYLELTEIINGEVSPVSVVWKYLRQNYPGIELYQADESHPSAAGSYAAACCFYASIFKKDPTLITFNFGLTASDAAIIKNAAKTHVFDNLQLWDFKKLPTSNFIYQVGPGINEALFQPISQGVRQSYFWDFGDGSTSTTSYSTHSYSANGTYTVSLSTTNCDLQGVHTSFSDTVIQFCSHTPSIYTAHPWLCYEDTLWTQAATAYQWFVYGAPLPEFNQYISNYTQYGPSGFSVVSTLNACTELSQLYTGFPEWSGYYFNAFGNACNGDTATFALLHIDGFLSGFENIQWFKNDTLLPSMTNMDTLFITSAGKYECKVVNPSSICPLDTTSYILEIDCSGVGIVELNQELFWSASPNPASETLTINFKHTPKQEQIQIFDANGRLIKTTKALLTTKINVTDLARGHYYIRIKNKNQPPLKFIKL
jgi:Secretion system C-terminal sorting domain/PKD domain